MGSQIKEKRAVIAAHVARSLGLGDPSLLAPEDRATLDQRVAEVIAGRDAGTSDPVAAGALPGLVADYRNAVRQLRADTADTRLAEQGEVFAQEDDA